MKPLWIVSLFLMCIGCVHVESNEPSDWMIWIEDGKTGGKKVENISTLGIPEEYFETLQRVCYWNVGKAGTPEERSPYLRKHLTITQLGHWGTYDVFDVTNQKARHKSIMLKDDIGKCRILYTQFSWCTADVTDLPDIVEISGQSILSYRTRIPGTGNSYIEYYFAYDKTNGCPQRIDIVTPINKELSRILPKDHGVWKGGGLDFKGMKYSRPVWKKGDGNASPTGGKVDLNLSLQNGKLLIVNSKHIPEYDWN